MRCEKNRRHMKEEGNREILKNFKLFIKFCVVNYDIENVDVNYDTEDICIC